MANGNITAAECGLEVVDIGDHPDFVGRPLRPRNMAAQSEEMQRLLHLFVEDPPNILQRLADAAVQLCGADSAGISIERPEQGDTQYWYWAAVSGAYKHFAESSLARYPSACGLALDRNAPQHLIVKQEFFDLMGLVAPVVTDGMLLPWHAGGRRGTIWILAHGRTQAFDVNDLLVAGTIADFAAMAMRENQALNDGAVGDSAMVDWARSVKEPIEVSMKQMFLEATRRSEQGSKPN